MKRIRQWLAKDKFLIVRGSVILALLLVSCAGLSARMLLEFGSAAVELHASDAANGFAAQFEQLVRSWFSSLDGAARMIQEDSSREALFLRMLSDYNPYDEVGVLSGDTIRHADGSVGQMQYENAYIYSEGGVPRGRFIAQGDGSILLCVTIDESSELAARYDAEGVAEMLRSGFDDDYGFAVYNASTGAYLVNGTNLSGGGYYDTLLALNEDGSAAGLLNDETTIARLSAGEDDIYIAQRRTGIRPWNVALVIEGSQLSTYAGELAWMPWAVAAALLLLLAIVALFAALSLRRIRARARGVDSARDDYARLIHDLAVEAEVTLFTYCRGQDALRDCYDGLELFGGADLSQRHVLLRELEEACGLKDEDVEQLHECLRELANDSITELTLRGALPDREERELRFVLDSFVADHSVIVCSVRDCTQERHTQTRANLEQSYLDANMQRTGAVWELNVSRNLWHCIYMKDRAAMGVLGALSDTGWRDFTADLNNVLREYIHPADYADHASKMNISSIAKFYRSGRTEINLDYRVRVEGRGDYVWHRMRVHLYPEPETEDILANIYVFNVDVEKHAELERDDRQKVFTKTLRALSGIYYALYYVDLDNDLCYAAKSHDGEVVTQLCTPYRETFDNYLEGIHEEDREEIRAMLDTYNIRRAFVEGSRFQRKEYRRITGDGYRWAAIIIQPARYENGRIKDVVIAQRNLVGSRPDLDLE